MNTIECKKCGNVIEIDKALEGQIESRVLEAANHQHQAELAKIEAEAEANAKRNSDAAAELMRREAAADLEIAKQRIESEAKSAQKKAEASQALLIKSLQDSAASAKDDTENAKQESQKLRAELTDMMKHLREEKQARANAELEAQKKLNHEADKIRSDATREADEKQRLNLAEKDKQLETAKRQVEDMQRKLNQGSQQMQGEILELDLEELLKLEFRDDEVKPVEKGIKGADVRQTVRNQRGSDCGIILWEIKRTKNWTESWIQKLKDDLRDTKANIPIIITEAMPKDQAGEIVNYKGVWVAKPSSTVILATLLRKSLLDVGREKAVAQNRDTSADALYGFVTSHEFVNQIEAMVEVYMEMITDIAKEKAAFDRVWAKRDAQAKKLLGGTANIIGSMQAQVGTGSMPKIKGLELLGSGEEEL
ncbi:MAG: DUF2130 domain-containing protein [Candidatus Saccharimonadales bacterium]